MCYILLKPFVVAGPKTGLRGTTNGLFFCPETVISPACPDNFLTYNRRIVLLSSVPSRLLWPAPKPAIGDSRRRLLWPCVRSFPVALRHRFVWVWPGDPALADPARVPDLHWNDDPAWAGDGKLITVKCDYRLVLDNLMDLTHETFVHGTSIGQRAVAEAPFVATHGDRTATVPRWMEDIAPPPFWAGQIRHARGYEGKVDRWQIIRFEAPATIAIDVGVAPAGSGAVPRDGQPGDRLQGVNGFVLNTITPETESTCHYFWAFARNYCLGEQRLTHELREGVATIFREDELILEAQQQAIAEHPGYRFYNLNIDAGSMWARRLIDRMIESESGAARASRVVAIRPAA